MINKLPSFLRRPFARHASPHPATEHDRLVAAHLAWHLERRIVGAHDLQFLVHHGTVILQGRMEDARLRENIVAEAGRVAGVRRVIDRMSNGPQGTYGMAA